MTDPDWIPNTWYTSRHNADLRVRRYLGINHNKRAVAYDYGAGSKIWRQPASMWRSWVGNPCSLTNATDLAVRFKCWPNLDKVNYVTVSKYELEKLVIEYDQAVAAATKHYWQAQAAVAMLPDEIKVGELQLQFEERRAYFDKLRTDFADIVSSMLGMLNQMTDTEFRSMLPDENDEQVSKLGFLIGFERLMDRAACIWFQVNSNESRTIGPTYQRAKAFSQRLSNFIHTLKFPRT